MSLILDALHGGRARATPRPNSSAAQTAAVLQTLGYGHFAAASAFNRIRRLVGYAFLGLMVGVAIWGTVIWLAAQYRLLEEPAIAPSPPQTKFVAPRPAAVRPPPLLAEESASSGVPEPVADAPPPSLAGSSAGFGAPRPPSRAGTPAGTAAPAPPPSPAGTSAGSGIPGTPIIVQHSRRPDVPLELPPPPAGAPSSRTAQSITAGSNAGTLVPDADHFQLALYYQRSGDFENALLQYRAVLQRDELNAEAHNNLGLLYRGKGLYDEAVKEFVRAIAINQRYVKAHNNLGVTYLSQRKNDAAAAEFQTALAIDPRNVESLVNLSLAEKDGANVEQARASLTHALELDPRSAEAHYNLALMADEMGDKALAITHYRAFLQYANGYPDLVPQVRGRIDALSR